MKRKGRMDGWDEWKVELIGGEVGGEVMGGKKGKERKKGKIPKNIIL